MSTVNQNEDRQLIDLIGYGVEPKNIYTDKQSGKDFKRPEYMRMLRRMKRNDLLVIKSIDRLGRNYTEILDEWKLITHKKGADIVVLDMPLLDTTKSKDLLGTFISDLVLQLLFICGYLKFVKIYTEADIFCCPFAFKEQYARSYLLGKIK